MNRNARTLAATPSTVAGIFAAWPPLAQLQARVMVDKFGPPQESSVVKLQWNGPTPWTRIVVTDHPRTPLEQVVSYRVPASKLAALAAFHHGLQVHADEETLAARGDSEESNRLALNLANDIVTGKMTPAQADSFFTKEIQLAEAGKASPYTERLLFVP